MKHYLIVIFFVIPFLTLTQGCSFIVRDYRASALNVKNIKKKYNKSGLKISIQRSASDDSQTTLMICRIIHPVRPDKGISFEKYVTDALISEIKYAGIFSEDAKRQFKISYEDISFNSFVGMGKWVIASSITSQNGKDFKVNSIFEFSTN